MNNLTHLFKHPELLNKETLYDLRSIIALHPYYQPARYLLLQNLFLLHDSSFDDELRRAALYISDRNILFQLIEGAHYQLQKAPSSPAKQEVGNEEETESQTSKDNRTNTLIDNWLQSLPAKEEEKTEKKATTYINPATDYISYMLEHSSQEEDKEQPQLKGQNLIDDFIKQDSGRPQLQETLEYTPEEETSSEEQEAQSGDSYFTETLARIYIKQGRYSKALEIINRLNLLYPKKNRYFADQIRFLEKLIVNNNK